MMQACFHQQRKEVERLENHMSGPPTDLKYRSISLFLTISNGALMEGFLNVRLVLYFQVE